MHLTIFVCKISAILFRLLYVNQVKIKNVCSCEQVWTWDYIKATTYLHRFILLYLSIVFSLALPALNMKFVDKTDQCQTTKQS